MTQFNTSQKRFYSNSIRTTLEFTCPTKKSKNFKSNSTTLVLNFTLRKSLLRKSNLLLLRQSNQFSEGGSAENGMPEFMKSGALLQLRSRGYGEITINIRSCQRGRDTEKERLLISYRGAAEAILTGGKLWSTEMNKRLNLPISISKILTFE